MPYEMSRDRRFRTITMGDRWFVIQGGPVEHLICEAAGEVTAHRIATVLNNDPETVQRHFDKLAAS